MPDGVLKKRLGWKPASKMLNRYSHITDMQTDEATLRVLGHETNGNGESIKKRVCPRCQTENEFRNYCSKCSLPMNDKASTELIEKQKRFDAIMYQASKEPRFGKILEIMGDIMSRHAQ